MEAVKHKQTALSAKDMALCGLFTALIAVGAFIKINIPVQPYPMHFTLQFFFILLAGFLLGPRIGVLSVCVYLAVGLAGVPVFAAGGGPAYLIRPTFGFLIGFVLAAYSVGKVSSLFQRGSYSHYLAAALCGLAADYICGMVYFYVISNYIIHMPVSWGLVFVNCFLLTVGEDFALCLLAAMVAKRLIPIVERF